MRQFAALAMLAAGMGATTTVNVGGDQFQAPDLDYFPKHKRGKGQNNRRGKGKCSPPKSRPNRLTISKRVRRKHRRQL